MKADGKETLRHRCQFLAALIDFSSDALLHQNLIVMSALAVCLFLRYDSLLALLWSISKGWITIDEG